MVPPTGYYLQSQEKKILEALPRLKLQNKSVSLFLVDHRMPKLTGSEFLEQAREIFPDAKRVLLTAYADTSVAIHAINKIKIDYYLTKPWTPPEVNLSFFQKKTLAFSDGMNFVQGLG